jgi:hypothetical protein
MVTISLGGKAPFARRIRFSVGRYPVPESGSGAFETAVLLPGRFAPVPFAFYQLPHGFNPFFRDHMAMKIAAGDDW